ncbi:ABC transporter [Streptomyces spiroverticillatus]|uniref:ABC transporter n=1 Tax=Streptomyces finlayi TaxID=67296 RepID=A0A918X886_9ACTN|nr:FtsX-like permease family protein [Streptomyces finlayi]GHA41513.1 ABC transporter [Streptomyces spiroverticillatus]GHD16593.1 ABC transporter [Streptomyces finlayi]
MFRTALRNVLAHKARLLMTILAVMLGVAFVSGTLIYSDTLNKAYGNQATKSLSNVSVGITSHHAANDTKQAPGLSEKQIGQIAALDGVESVSPRVNGFAGAASRKGELLAEGWSNNGANFSPGKDGKDPFYAFTDGNGPTKAGEIALDAETAKKGGYKVGDKVRVATNKPAEENTLTGVFTTEDGLVNAGGSLVLFDSKTAQKMFLAPGYYSDLSVTAKPGTDNDKLLAEIKPLLPENAQAQTAAELAAEQTRSIKQLTDGLTQILLAFAAIALFVGIFLIANTFTMLVAQRTKELALMRAVGASRKQITRSVLLEAMIVGLVASVVGFVIGVGMAAGMGPLMDLIGAQLPAGGMVITATPVLTALAVGVLITMLAAWLPGRRAAKIPPVAAMNSVHATETVKSLVVRNTIGAILALGGGAVIVGGAAMGKDGRTVIGFGAFLTLLGVIVLIPLLSRPLIRLIQPLLNRAFGISGKLAGLNSVRNPRRTGATASALAIGLTLVTGLTVLGVTAGDSLDRATRKDITADYQVSMANMSAMSQSTVDALAKAPGVVSATPKLSGGAQAGQNDYLGISGIEPKALGPALHLNVLDGSENPLARGEVAVTKAYADSTGLKVGQTLDLRYEDDKKSSVKVGAIFEDSDNFGDVVMDVKELLPHYQTPMYYEAFVKMDGGESAANKQALVDATGKNPAMVIMDKNEIAAKMGGMITQMLNMMYGLLAMALVIAVLGVVNTLAMSVFERQQEIGMLRAIGLDRGRVKSMIRLESVVISLFGAVVGVGLGTFIAWAIGQTVKHNIPEYALTIPWGRVGIFLLLAGVVGVLAAMWPARSAARLNMLAAIKAE